MTFHRKVILALSHSWRSTCLNFDDPVKVQVDLKAVHWENMAQTLQVGEAQSRLRIFKRLKSVNF